MTSLLYGAYAATVLLVAVGGLLGVVFGTPDVGEGHERRHQAVAVLAAAFLVALVVDFLL